MPQDYAKLFADFLTELDALGLQVLLIWA